MNKNQIFSILTRYIILLILGMFNIFLFYFIFTPLTFYPVLWILNLIYGSVISSPDTILFKGYFATLVPACIAGSAYYLLTILNLTTPMKAKTRAKSIIFLLASFLIINVIRIVIFAVIYAEKGYELFNTAHLATWYFGSTILVVLLWFANVLIFKIHNIPIYTDIKNIYSQIKGKK